RLHRRCGRRDTGGAVRRHCLRRGSRGLALVWHVPDPRRAGNLRSSRSVRFFYKPAPGVVGDAIPYYFDGRYHVFFLHDLRDADSYGTGYGWAHMSTTDFVHFEQHAEALPRGGADAQDLFPATGSVFTDGTGKHHIFYTGINPSFRNETQRHQAILHAT